MKTLGSLAALVACLFLTLATASGQGGGAVPCASSSPKYTLEDYLIGTYDTREEAVDAGTKRTITDPAYYAALNAYYATVPCADCDATTTCNQRRRSDITGGTIGFDIVETDEGWELWGVPHLIDLWVQCDACPIVVE